MRPENAAAVIIPARLSLSEFAVAIDRPLPDVMAALEAGGELLGPGDMVGPEVTTVVARALGRQVAIETRDLTLEALYEVELRGETDQESLPPRASALVAGVLANRDALDEEIEAASEHWSVARMPLIDRTILRLGLYELRFESETPTAVVVSEAVRLAKGYSTERSGSFVNGVLATLAKENRG